MTSTLTAISPGTVKICGNRDPELCRLAAECGADLLGFIFVPGSKRCVDSDLARECVQVSKHGSNNSVRTVGVFVDEEFNLVNEISRNAGVDLVQLHGDESPSDLEQVEFPVLKVIRPRPGQSLDQVKKLVDSYMEASKPPVAILLDAFHHAQYGGTGLKADWELAAEFARTYPLLLAGGLTPDNVGEAISSVAPAGVDVSSGVEADGVRDLEKIRAFIKEAKQGFEYIDQRRSEVASETY